MPRLRGNSTAQNRRQPTWKLHPTRLILRGSSRPFPDDEPLAETTLSRFGSNSVAASSSWSSSALITQRSKARTPAAPKAFPSNTSSRSAALTCRDCARVMAARPRKPLWARLRDRRCLLDCRHRPNAWPPGTVASPVSGDGSQGCHTTLSEPSSLAFVHARLSSRREWLYVTASAIALTPCVPHL